MPAVDQRGRKQRHVLKDVMLRCRGTSNSYDSREGWRLDSRSQVWECIIFWRKDVSCTRAGSEKEKGLF